MIIILNECDIRTHFSHLIQVMKGLIFLGCMIKRIVKKEFENMSSNRLSTKGVLL